MTTTTTDTPCICTVYTIRQPAASHPVTSAADNPSAPMIVVVSRSPLSGDTP